MKYLRRIVLIVLITSTFSSKKFFAYAQTMQYREVLTISEAVGYTDAVFSPDGQKIATWIDLIELDIWDSTTGKKTT